LEKVIKSLLEVPDEVEHILKHPVPDVMFDGFGDSAWNMRLRVWLKDPSKYYPIRSEINCAIVHKFRKHHIEIPFPQRDLHVKSPLPVPLNMEGQN
jgi:small-conductance mechanosensitive channel